ncbi:hypothetical protein NDU88_001751 [Pleurodeles waltl]|uniref:Uncharacterized protein n=1 Tax=Pleurodeles waltl TaxID=8319 RepID=A0AAV7VAZ5_PLEWA|nr:hypothetical protein NDU88_001751 [Pleurodeles waltl]
MWGVVEDLNGGTGPPDREALSPGLLHAEKDVERRLQGNEEKPCRERQVEAESRAGNKEEGEKASHPYYPPPGGGSQD